MDIKGIQLLTHKRMVQRRVLVVKKGAGEMHENMSRGIHR